MMMGSGSTTTVSMAMTMSMPMASESGASSSMPSASATSSGMSGMGDSGMDMSSSTGMNMHFTTHYAGVPVLFETLSAATGGKAFGIFCILFFTAFAFRGLSFLQNYVELRIFRDERFPDGQDVQVHVHVTDVKQSSSDLESTTTTQDLRAQPAQRSVVAKFFDYTPIQIYRDFIRLVITFVSVMIGYALMLAVMSFVVLYFFAVVLGMAFGEIFFQRLSYALDVQAPASVCSTVLH